VDTLRRKRKQVILASRLSYVKDAIPSKNTVLTNGELEQLRVACSFQHIIHTAAGNIRETGGDVIMTIVDLYKPKGAVVVVAKERQF
jgi:hypothetical protein